MLKWLFRWILRTIVLLLALVAFAAISDYITHRVAHNSVLVLELDGPVVERGQGGVLRLLSGGHAVALNVVREALHNAGEDPRIVGLAVEVIDPHMELAQAQELSGLIHEFAGHGKWTAAYLESAGEFEPGNSAYLVASAADEVSLMPQGELNLLGVQLREMFLRGTFDWLGIKPNMEAIGQYKSARNVFTEKDFTPPQREEDDALVASLFGQIVGQISKQRKLDGDAVRGLIDHAPLTAAAGLKAHLVDKLEYQDQFSDRMKHRGGRKHPLLDYDNYARPRLLPSMGETDQIAVIYGSGEIQRGSGGFDPLLSPSGAAMGSDSMEEAFTQAREDDSVRAVVFRVDSPGGSVIGSELIRRQVELTARKKPVVVSMSGYAASGGYWVSTPAAKIIADAGTITGSIGVLGGKFNIAPAAAKLGINTDAVARGANVAMFDQFADFTPGQLEILRTQILGDTYQQFVALVAHGRHLSVDQVNQVAQGRVWTGEQALPIKLVDRIGDFDAALKEARAEAKLPPQKKVGLIELPVQPGLIESLLSGRDLDGRLSAAILKTLAPLRHVAQLAPAARGFFGELYCTRMPIL